MFIPVMLIVRMIMLVLHRLTQQPEDRGHAEDFRGTTGVNHTDDGLQTRMNTGFGVPT